MGLDRRGLYLLNHPFKPSKRKKLRRNPIPDTALLSARLFPRSCSCHHVSLTRLTPGPWKNSQWSSALVCALASCMCSAVALPHLPTSLIRTLTRHCACRKHGMLHPSTPARLISPSDTLLHSSCARFELECIAALVRCYAGPSRTPVRSTHIVAPASTTLRAGSSDTSALTCSRLTLPALLAFLTVPR